MAREETRGRIERFKNLAIQYLRARASGDSSFVAGRVSKSDGTLFMGAGQDEWWQGHDAIVATIKTNVAKDTRGVSVLIDQAAAYSEGTVGWVAVKFKLRFGAGKEMPLRLSAVFRKEDGEWRIVL